ncbi:MAG: hypothetical protein QOH97_5009 [Actinoplanes sp.]|jgi:hypothetical protein|nr:hypothetical protein [Actinoplanes sp.]
MKQISQSFFGYSVSVSWGTPSWAGGGLVSGRVGVLVFVAGPPYTRVYDGPV